MANETTNYVRQKAIELTGKRYCTHCQTEQDSKGGSYKILNNGKHQRWQCSKCTAKKIARLHGHTDLSRQANA